MAGFSSESGFSALQALVNVFKARWSTASAVVPSEKERVMGKTISKQEQLPNTTKIRLAELFRQYGATS